MAFHPGQIVECISDHWITDRVSPIKGQRYTVVTETVGKSLIGLVLRECPAFTNGKLNPYGWAAKFFRPLTDISQLQELLKVKELEDV